MPAALAGPGGDVPVQRCTVHKERNLPAHAPKHLHDEIKADFSDMMYAVDAETLRMAPRLGQKEGPAEVGLPAAMSASLRIRSASPPGADLPDGVADGPVVTRRRNSLRQSGLYQEGPQARCIVRISVGLPIEELGDGQVRGDAHGFGKGLTRALLVPQGHSAGHGIAA